MAYSKTKEIFDILEEIDKFVVLVDAIQVGYGLSKADISRLLGVNEKTFNGWYHGTAVMRYPRMMNLALEAIKNRLK